MEAKNFKGYIAHNEFTPAFDNVRGKTAKSAIAAIKRKHSPYWLDCSCWAVFVHENGDEEIIHKSDVK